MSNLVRYGNYTVEAAEADDSRVASVSGNVYMDLQVGDNVVRFLPPKLGKNSPLRVTAIHYVKDIPGLSKKLVFACPRVEHKLPCIVCAEAERLAKTGNAADKEAAWEIAAKLRVLANVVDRSVENPLDGLRILGFGKKIHNPLKNIRKNPRLGGDYTDPTEKGFDIVINRVGTGKNDTEYDVKADRTSSPLAPTVELINELIESQIDLDTLIDATIPEELVRAWGLSRVSAQVPAQIGGGTPVGQGLMQQHAMASQLPAAQPQQTIASAIVDAKGQEVVGYDDDFNPIYK